jgi:hypothetical protein
MVSKAREEHLANLSPGERLLVAREERIANTTVEQHGLAEEVGILQRFGTAMGGHDADMESASQQPTLNTCDVVHV